MESLRRKIDTEEIIVKGSVCRSALALREAKVTSLACRKARHAHCWTL